jgi:hypothetical protein
MGLKNLWKRTRNEKGREFCKWRKQEENIKKKTEVANRKNEIYTC